MPALLGRRTNLLLSETPLSRRNWVGQVSEEWNLSSVPPSVPSAGAAAAATAVAAVRQGPERQEPSTSGPESDGVSAPVGEAEASGALPDRGQVRLASLQTAPVGLSPSEVALWLASNSLTRQQQRQQEKGRALPGGGGSSAAGGGGGSSTCGGVERNISSSGGSGGGSSVFRLPEEPLQREVEDG